MVLFKNFVMIMLEKMSSDALIEFEGVEIPQAGRGLSVNRS